MEGFFYLHILNIMVRNEFKNIYLISYKKNGKWNPIMEESRKRYDQMGFNVKLFENLKPIIIISNNRKVLISYLH